MEGEIVKDFLGQELLDGDFVTYPGKGNGAAEYGLLLMRVEKISADSITAERLDPNYGPDGKRQVIKRKKTTIKAVNRLVKVYPPKKMIEVFENPDKHFALVSKWIHGRTDINWETLTIGKMRD